MPPASCISAVAIPFDASTADDQKRTCRAAYFGRFKPHAYVWFCAHTRPTASDLDGASLGICRFVCPGPVWEFQASELKLGVAPDFRSDETLRCCSDPLDPQT